MQSMALAHPYPDHAEWFFDWYTATVERVRPSHLFETVAHLYGSGTEIERSKGLNRYDYTDALVLDGEVQFRMSHGGMNQDPSIEARGSMAPIFVDRLRATFPRHRPSRLDSAFDADFEGGFESTVESVKQWNENSALLKHKSTKHVNGCDGDTHYFGARASGALFRIYQRGFHKAKELKRAKLPLRPNWFRCENELHPTSLPLKLRSQGLTDNKDFAAKCSASDAWILSSWGPSLLLHLTNLHLEPLPAAPKLLTSMEREWQVMLEQGAKRWLKQMRYYELTAAEIGIKFTRDALEIEKAREQRKHR